MKRATIVFLLLAVLQSGQKAFAYEIAGWDVHGTFSQGWIHSKHNNFIEDSTDGTFDFREFGINASTSIGEKVTVGGQLFAREYGAIGNDDIYLDWLSVSYSFNDKLGVRAGKLKMPYGLYGETRDVDSLRTQILLPLGVYVESYRGSINSMWGGALFGTLDLANWGVLDYSLQIGRTAINEDSGEMSRLASFVELEIESVDDGGAGAIKLLWNTPARGLRVGSTITWSEFSGVGSTDRLLGFPGTFEADVKEQYFIVSSAEYTLDRATFAIEYMYSNIEAESKIGLFEIPPIEFDIEMHGYYLNAQYRFTDQFTVAVGYSAFRLQQNSIAFIGESTSENERNEYYASLRYDITPNLIAKVEQHFTTGKAGLFLTENPGGLEDDWSMTLLKLSFVF
jgi:predicted porin